MEFNLVQTGKKTKWKLCRIFIRILISSKMKYSSGSLKTKKDAAHFQLVLVTQKCVLLSRNTKCFFNQQEDRSEDIFFLWSLVYSEKRWPSQKFPDENQNFVIIHSDKYMNLVLWDILCIYMWPQGTNLYCMFLFFLTMLGEKNWTHFLDAFYWVAGDNLWTTLQSPGQTAVCSFPTSLQQNKTQIIKLTGKLKTGSRFFVLILHTYHTFFWHKCSALGHTLG